MRLPMDEHRGISPPNPKRRRKVKANADKKFECKHAECGKTYSRAEHLYRHQLNHKPKAIYYCQHPGCAREFVRQDLCVRHQERHSSQGSQLQKRDASSQLPGGADGRPLSSPNSNRNRHSSFTSATPQAPSILSPKDQALGEPNIGERSVSSPGNTRKSNSTTSASSISLEPQCQPPTPRSSFPIPESFPKGVISSTGYPFISHQKQELTPLQREDSRTSYSDENDRPFSTTTSSPTVFRSDSFPTPQASADEADGIHAPSSHFHPPMITSAPSVQSINDYMKRSTLRLSHTAGFSTTSIVQTSKTSLADAINDGLDALDPVSAAHYAVPGDRSSVDLTASFTYPIFGGDEYNRSPVAREAEFTAWLFNDNQTAVSGFGPAPNILPGYVDIAATQIQGPYYSDRNFAGYYPPPVQTQHPMSVMSILDSTEPTQTIISEEKRHELLHLMRYQFIERETDLLKRFKDSVFEGDVDAPRHILCLGMLEMYIGSYFYHQHAQLPILHRPTFCADKTPNLLLLVVIAIGAATLDKVYGSALTDEASDFANFIAWHVRWEIVRDKDYRPPAKLWVFQTLILLEVYEKMYSTRALHERAHINHDTTLTLMRRGTSLIGRAANESPGSLRDGKTARSSGSNSASDAVATDESWYQWIRHEATRRIAFAAFVIDSIHATMFGHSAKMVAYEIRLPLPCDEALWSATSAQEVARVQSSHQTNGIKPTMFLDGLKKTLNGDRVRTNSFGRTILMSGLLSVNYLLRQRDIQISALRAPNTPTAGSNAGWRNTLLRAFDNWKKDFDQALAEAYPEGQNTHMTGPVALRPIDEDNLFESRTVLHHLAHMASCSSVDIFDCQTYAGARRLLGRPIGIKALADVGDKMKNRWVHTSSARDATFHALKFLIQVLDPATQALSGVTILPKAFDEQGRYLARDDFLCNRPWVLYFSALVVWCYGFARDGPLQPVPPDDAFATPEDNEKDMKAFIGGVAHVTKPEELEHVKGMNRCVGLLGVLRGSFSATRWELTHEAAFLLDNCIKKLLGKVE